MIHEMGHVVSRRTDAGKYIENKYTPPDYGSYIVNHYENPIASTYDGLWRISKE